jgi:hypothetical protein
MEMDRKYPNISFAPNWLRFEKPRVIYRGWLNRIACWLGVPQKNWNVEYRFTVLADDTVLE